MVPLSELAIVNPLGDLFGEKYFELKRIYAVKTNENRYVVFYVSRVEDDYIRIRYRIWDNGIRKLAIAGQFYSEHYKLPAGVENAEFVPSKLHSTLSVKNDLIYKTDNVPALDDERRVVGRKVNLSELVRTDIKHEVSTMSILETAQAIQRDNYIFSKMALADKRIGDWVQMVAWRKKAKGTFVAQIPVCEVRLPTPGRSTTRNWRGIAVRLRLPAERYHLHKERTG